MGRPLILLIFTLLLSNCLSAQNDKKTMIQPPYLQKGDTIAIVAPSGILKNKEAHIQRATNLLKSWGLEILVGQHVFKDGNHFAGSDKERTEDFQIALDNPNIKAIWCARGGYGAVRIIDNLDYTKFKESPKWIIGYSDITAIHNDLNVLGYQSIQAILCTSLTEDLKNLDQSIDTFRKALFGEQLNYEIDASEYNKLGNVQGELVGGNLTLLHTMLGSRSSINTDGKILFIEEIGEYAYHIDRMLQSLKRAGYFDNLNGLIIGDMSNIRENTTEWGSSIEQLILDVVDSYDFPVAFNFPAGHEDDNRALIFGKKVTLSVSKVHTTLDF